MSNFYPTLTFLTRNSREPGMQAMAINTAVLEQLEIIVAVNSLVFVSTKFMVLV